MQNLKLDGRTIAIGVLLLIAAVVFLPQLLGNNADTNVNEPLNVPANSAPDNQLAAGVTLGRLVTAEAVDRDGCPVDTTSTFAANSDVVYVVTEESDFAQGTDVFVRFYLDGQVYEESESVVADQEYRDTCLAFTLEPDQATSLRPGNYEAELVINGNRAESVSFSIQ